MNILIKNIQIMLQIMSGIYTIAMKNISYKADAVKEYQQICHFIFISLIFRYLLLLKFNVNLLLIPKIISLLIFETK